MEVEEVESKKGEEEKEQVVIEETIQVEQKEDEQGDIEL